MRAIFIAVNTDGIKLFRSISDMVCPEMPACLARCVWFKPSRAGSFQFITHIASTP